MIIAANVVWKIKLLEQQVPYWQNQFNQTTFDHIYQQSGVTRLYEFETSSFSYENQLGSFAAIMLCVL